MLKLSSDGLSDFISDTFVRANMGTLTARVQSDEDCYWYVVLKNDVVCGKADSSLELIELTTKLIILEKTVLGEFDVNDTNNLNTIVDYVDSLRVKGKEEAIQRFFKGY